MQTFFQNSRQKNTIDTIKCKQHPTNDIILICISGECNEPLCKQCCIIHTENHNKRNSKAEFEIIETIRDQCYNDLNQLQLRFEKEQQILKHFSDNQNSIYFKEIHQKLDDIKRKLLLMINDFCSGLEKALIQKIEIHRVNHPGEKKELHHRLKLILNDIDEKVKGLKSPNYINMLVSVIKDEKQHNYESLQNEIDQSIRHYLGNMFEIGVNEEVLVKIKSDLSKYVLIQETNLEHLLDQMRGDFMDDDIPNKPNNTKQQQLNQIQTKNYQTQSSSTYPNLNKTQSQSNQINVDFIESNKYKLISESKRNKYDL